MAMAVVSCGVNKPAAVVEPIGTTLITIDSAGVVPSFDGTLLLVSFMCITIAM